MKRNKRKLIGSAVLAVLAVSAFVVPASGSSHQSVVSGDVIRTWNSQALDAVRKRGASDAQAARLYAMVNVAMFDAVNGLAPAAQRREPALVAPEPGVSGDARAAAAGAAHDILVAFEPLHASYQSRVATHDAQLASDLTAVRSTGQEEHGRVWGARVARAVLDARSDDGSVGDETQPAGTGVGEFRRQWCCIQFQALKPFAVEDSRRYLGDGPPDLKSRDYADAFNEVKVVGDRARPDPDALATYNFWSLSGGTGQPPGAWVQVARTVSADRGLSLSETARLFALQTMAMADTVAPTYKTKVDHHFWRPITAINEAGTDGNDATDPPPPGTQWTQRAPDTSGGSPEHWSGHSSFSAAGASVLAGFFCTDEISFTLVSDSTRTARTYTSLSVAAAEAGRSRVLGGIHFEFSNQAGLEAGDAVARDVLATALQPANEYVPATDCAA